MDIADNLTQTLTQVAALRAELEQVKAGMDALLNSVRWSPEYMALDARRTAASAELKTAEDTARAQALAEFQATQVKKMPGVTVKTFTTTRLEYDLDVAAKWIEKHAKYLYVIDWQRFEAEALASRENLPLKFVKYIDVEENKAQIASNLSAFLQIPEPVEAPEPVEQIPF